MTRRGTGPLNTGKYQLIKPLATGGMGEIYLARTRGIEGFERLVVLKRLKPDIAARAENIAMFLDEVRLLASVQHANVVRIYDVGTSSDGGFFYAMEYLHGQDLRAVMRSVRTAALPTISLLVSVGAAVLSGLHHVHERNGPDGKPLHIVHRDVSPANIFVTYEGEVKLLDFGIALAASRKTQTEAGVVKGKFRYMSPEQCRTDPLDRRSDVFALGVVLWEMATGKSLFKTDSDVKTLFAIVERDAPLISTLVPGFPPALEQIIARALRRPVAERWQSAQQMQAALEDFALENKISLSASPLARLMEERFAEEIHAWSAAQKEGKDLAAFVSERATQEEGSGSSRTPSGSSSAGRAIEPPPDWQVPAPRPAPGEEPTNSFVVTHQEPTRRSRAPMLAGAAVALLALGGVAFAFTRPVEPKPSAPLQVQAPAPAPEPLPPPAPEKAPAPNPPPAVAAPEPPVVVVPAVVAPAPVAPAPVAPKGTRRPNRAPSEKPPKPAPADAPDSSPWDKDSPVPPS